MARREREEAQVVRLGGVLYRLEPVGPGVAKARPRMTFAEAASRFVAAAELRHRPSTVAATRMLLDLHVLPVLGHLRLDEIDRGVLASMQDAFRSRRRRGSGPVAATTVNLRVAKALAVLHFARDELGAVESVARLRPLPHERRQREHVRAHYEALLRSVQPPWLRLLALLAGDAGLRVGECLALRWACVRAASLCVCATVWKGHRGPTKGGRARVVPCPARLVEALAETERVGPLVLPSHLYSEKVLARLRTACRRARVPRLTTHGLRALVCLGASGPGRRPHHDPGPARAQQRGDHRSLPAFVRGRDGGCREAA